MGANSQTADDPIGLHSDHPNHPERLAENRTRYVGILRDHRLDVSSHIKRRFLEEMEGREYGAREMLDAFDWFLAGWNRRAQ